jgi:hypothetical protein
MSISEEEFTDFRRRVHMPSAFLRSLSPSRAFA